MVKRDFHRIKIDEETIFISKNTMINTAVSKLFKDIDSDKIEKIIQAIVSYDNVGISGACLKKRTLTNREIKINKEYFSIAVNMFATYIDISEECSIKVIEIINNCIDKVLAKRKIGGVLNE